VAVSTIDKLVDYCMNTPEDRLRSAASVQAINMLIDKNIDFAKQRKECETATVFG